MFDEFNPMMYGMYPGMMWGMMGGMGSAFMGMPQYRQPGADVYSQLGIMSPQQRMFQGVNMQNMMEQQQLARRQQMMLLQREQMGMGAQSAQVGSGFAGPMLMQMGGLQPSWSNGITSGVNALISKFGPQGQGQQGQGGMTPMGPQAQASMGINPNDPQSVIAAGYKANNGDPAKSLRWAADYYNNSKDPNQQMLAGRLYEQAEQLREKEQQSNADTGRSNAQAAEARARANSTNATLNAPRDLGTIITPDSRQWRQYAEYDPQTKKYNVVRVGGGIPMQYNLPETPGGQQKNGDNFQNLVTTQSTAINRIDAVQKEIAAGAPVGDTQDIVSKLNDVVGTIGQFVDKGFASPGATAYLGQTLPTSTFGKWATAGEMTESNMQDMVMTVAAGYAGGKQISKSDVARAEESLGAASSSPSTLGAVLTSVRGRVIGDVDRQAAFIKSRGGTTAFLNSIDGMRSQFHKMVDTPQGASSGGDKTLTYNPATGTFQ